MRRLLTLGAAAGLLLLLPSCGAVIISAINNASKTKDAQDVQFFANDKQGLILIAVKPALVRYILHITQYDEQKQALILRSFSSSVLVDVAPSATPAPIYLAKKVEPGSYVYSFLADQLGWAACFQADTRKFTINAGEAVFLGAFNPPANLQQIEQLTVASGGLTKPIVNGVTFYYDNIIPPQITVPGTASADFTDAKNYAASSMPSLRTRLQPVAYQPAIFQLGKNIFGQQGCVN